MKAKSRTSRSTRPTAPRLSLLHTKEAPLSNDGSEIPSLHTLHGQLEDFAYDVLGDLYGGWEDNDGAYGEITLDVLKATATLDHNARFTDAHNTVSEL